MPGNGRLARHGGALAVIAQLMCSGFAVARQPGDRLTTGRPERRLGRLSVDSRVADIEARYGKPTSIAQSVRCWRQEGYSLCAEVLQGAQYRCGGFIQAISVECLDDCHSANVSTSRGLRLGESLSRAKSLYGSRYVDLAEYGLKGIEFRWEEGYELRLETNATGRIGKMTVLGPE